MVLNTPCTLTKPFLTGLMILFSGSLLAQEHIPAISWTNADDAKVSKAAGEQKSSSQAKSVRLNHFSSNWSKVLQQLAEDSGSTLVMSKCPNARYSRRDRNFYSRTEAVRILNRELERYAYRVIEQEDYLIVIPLKQVRADYRPTVLPPHPSVLAEKQELSRAGDGRTSQTVRQTGYLQEAAKNSVPSSSNAVSKAGSRKSETPQPEKIQQRMTFQHQSALSLFRKVYLAFSDRAEILNAGPGGFPAFRVLKPAAKPGERQEVDFAISIDQKNHVLIAEGSAEKVKAITGLFKMLDRPVQQETQQTFIPAEQNVQIAARKLNPALKLIAQANQKENSRNNQNVGQPENQTPNPNGNQPSNGNPNQPVNPNANQNNPGEIKAGGLEAGLKGNVVIQNVPGMGLVVTGNDEDVKKVMEVIRRIEQLSVGTVPDVQVRLLRHVESAALSELLTSVYEQIKNLQADTTRPASASFIPLVSPNGVLIVAPGVATESINELISKLDQPLDPTTEFEVFHLANAPASRMQTLVEEFYQERGGLAPRVRIIADMRTNAVVVQARPRDLKEIRLLVRKLDRDHSNAVSQMKIVPLKHALASELADVITTTLQSVFSPLSNAGVGGFGGTGQNSELLQDAKSTIMQFMVDNQKQGKKIHSGILTDIRVTADARSNALVVTAPKQSMELMLHLIRELDQPPSSVAEIKVFALKHADATNVVTLLQELFNTEDQTQDRPGVVVAGAQQGSSLVPLKFSTDVRTNSVIMMGDAKALQQVEAMLYRLDEEDTRKRQNTIYRLKNSPAADVADAINAFLESRRDIDELDPALATPLEQTEREVIVVAEPVTNSLIISATSRYYAEILALVQQLDEAPAQVLIQALLVEVALDNDDEFGVELGFQDSLLFDRSVVEILETLTTTTTAPNGVQTTTTDIVSQTSTPGFNFNNAPLGNNTAGPRTASLGKQALSSFGVGRVNSELGFGGLVLSAGSENISILLRALSQQRDVNILSRPQIRTLDNQLAQIQVGQQVPIVNGVNVGVTGVANPTIVQEEAGIILSVTPRINSDGVIVMEVLAEKSQFSGAGVPVFTQTDGSVITSPIKDITTARATVSVPNNQTIVLGGMITQAQETVTRKVPWLGDIPILRHAFSYDAHSSRRTELLMFLTPRIIRHDYDSEMIKQIETERLHFIQEDAESIHGPIYGVPAEEAPMVNTGFIYQSGQGMAPHLHHLHNGPFDVQPPGATSPAYQMEVPGSSPQQEFLAPPSQYGTPDPFPEANRPELPQTSPVPLQTPQQVPSATPAESGVEELPNPSLLNQTQRGNLNPTGYSPVLRTSATNSAKAGAGMIDASAMSLSLSP